MSTLQFKIFSRDGEYVAATKRPEEAAILVAVLGDGAEIRTGHRKVDAVWREGRESQPSSESYDFVAQTINARTSERRAKALARFA